MWEFWRSRMTNEYRQQRHSSESQASDSERPENRPRTSITVNFKDLNILVEDDSVHEESSDQRIHHSSELERFVEKDKLIIFMVGLPGRGKTFLCNKLVSYLNWLLLNIFKYFIINYF